MLCYVNISASSLYVSMIGFMEKKIKMMLLKVIYYAFSLGYELWNYILGTLIAWSHNF